MIFRAVTKIDLNQPGPVPSTSRPVWLPRRTGHPVATTPGPYRAEVLAKLVELADTGHYQPITQTTIDLDERGRSRPAQGGPHRPLPTLCETSDIRQIR